MSEYLWQCEVCGKVSDPIALRTERWCRACHKNGILSGVHRARVDPAENSVEAAEEQDITRLDEPFVIRETISDDDSDYRSPFYLGPLGDVDGGEESYHGWRHARNDFARTGASVDRERMLSFVTPDNPPLASSICSDKVSLVQRQLMWSVLVFTFFLTVLIIVSRVVG